MRCENKSFLQNDPGFLQEITSTAVEVRLVRNLCAGERSANDRPHCDHNHEASKDLQDNLEARVTSLLAAPEPAARWWAARCS
jgi:hypothetical protein